MMKNNSEYNRERTRARGPHKSQKLAAGEKKFIITTAILSILIVISVFNKNAFHANETFVQAEMQDHSRQIASVPLGTTNNEDVLAKELASTPLSESAKWGQDPSKVEQFTFGLLEGKYSVKLKDGKLNGLELTDASSQPKMVKNLEKFISENKEILPVKFDTISQVVQGDESVQKFNLMNPASHRIAEVEFHLDNMGRLISMKINKNL